MKYLWMVSFLWMTLSTQACDVCGCSAMDTRIGVLPDLRMNTLRAGYSFRSFETTHPKLFAQEQDRISNERYNSFALSARFFVWRNWMVTAELPYHNYEQQEDGTTFSTSGIGDASIGVQYLYTLPGDESTKLDQFLFGGGVKLPTGKRGVYGDDSGILNENMQPGSGSLDVTALVNYLRRRGKWGLQLQASARYNGANEEEYRFGERFSTSGRVLRWLNFGKNKQFIALPSAELGWDHSNADWLNDALAVRNTESGGYRVSAGVGLDVFIGRFGFNAQVQVPLWYEMGEGYIAPQQFAHGGFTFLF